MKQIVILPLSVILAFASCKKDSCGNCDAPLSGTFRSEEVAMYHGKAFTSVSLANGVPQQLSVSITDEAMNSLPGHHDHDDQDGDEHDPENETRLPLPSQAAATVFDHISINWNPDGHPPAGVYSFPHFDFHFYMITTDEQMGIPGYEEDSTGFLNYPAPQYMPLNYVPIPGGEAMMGTHWVDVTSPEMNGAPFTQTFIYGSYNGRVNFYEPMMTKAFLDSTASFERSIPQPASVPESGYYPTRIKLAKHSGITDIILDGFVEKQAG